jgi:hypothetical protein
MNRCVGKAFMVESSEYRGLRRVVSLFKAAYICVKSSHLNGGRA